MNKKIILTPPLPSSLELAFFKKQSSQQQKTHILSKVETHYIALH